MSKLLMLAAATLVLATAPAFAAEDQKPMSPPPAGHEAMPHGMPGGMPGGMNDGKRENNFKEADTNNDGSLSRDEFVAHAQKRSAELFAKMDANNDGKLTREEMDAFHQKMRDKFKEGRKPE